MAEHSTLTSNHILENWTYANAAARTGASGFVSGDLGKVAFQTDTGIYYRLTATTPTWVAITFDPDTDATMAANSDAKVASQKATKTILTLLDRLLFGPGSDGNLTLTQTDAAPSYATKSGSGATTTFSLSRDIFALNLTFDDANGNFIVNTNGYRIFANGTFLIKAGATVHNNGGDASGAVGGTAAGIGTTGASQAVGQAGRSTAGSTAAPTAMSHSIATTSVTNVNGGGNGGASSGGPGAGGGGGGGGLVGCTTSFGSPTDILQALSLRTLASTSIPFQGGNSGSCGDDTTSSTSGAGGAGGGIVAIYAKTLTNNGAIQAKGGNGGNASGAGTGSGGGGTGGGGAIVLVYIATGSTVGTTSVAAGATGGTAQGAGKDGAVGVAGVVWSIPL